MKSESDLESSNFQQGWPFICTATIVGFRMTWSLPLTCPALHSVIWGLSDPYHNVPKVLQMQLLTLSKGVDPSSKGARSAVCSLLPSISQSVRSRRSTESFRVAGELSLLWMSCRSKSSWLYTVLPFCAGGASGQCWSSSSLEHWGPEGAYPGWSGPQARQSSHQHTQWAQSGPIEVGSWQDQPVYWV